MSRDARRRSNDQTLPRELSFIFQLSSNPLGRTTPPRREEEFRFLSTKRLAALRERSCRETNVEQFLARESEKFPNESRSPATD